MSHRIIHYALAEMLSQFRRNAGPNISRAVMSALAPRGGTRCDGFRQKPDKRPPGQTRRQLVIENTIQSGDSLMCVVPSIIVLLITALVVFRRELTSGRATFEARAWSRAASLASVHAVTSSGSSLNIAKSCLVNANN